MLKRINIFYRLWNLKRSKKRMVKFYNSYIKTKQNSNCEDQSLISEAIFFIGEEDLKIREWYTDYLYKLANKLIIPIPEYDDKSIWEQVGSYRKHLLTSKGIFELKRLIRNEQKEVREIIFSWIALLIGLIGALIGLISVLKN